MRYLSPNFRRDSESLMRYRPAHVLGLTASLLLATPAWSDSSTPARFIAGWVEKVTLLPSGDLLKAKLDTGAKTSSINAHHIERFKKDGESWVRFELEYETVDGETRRQRMERPLVRRVRIKEHDGDHDSRVVVMLDFCINAQRHSAQFSLVDRSRFVYPMLLGRRFLKEVALIDPAATFEARAGCPVERP